jgi:hypothetical protein
MQNLVARFELADPMTDKKVIAARLGRRGDRRIDLRSAAVHEIRDHKKFVPVTGS